MRSDSFIEVAQDAVDLTGMTDVPWEHRAKLLSDKGPSYISRSFGEYLRLVSIRHILASPFHPQANGKLEQYHRTIKLDVNQIPYDVPGNLEVAITEFVNYYNNRRYHKVFGNVTPSDVLDGPREEILDKRKEVQTQTFQRRRQYNQRLRELAESARISISIVMLLYMSRSCHGDVLISGCTYDGIDLASALPVKFDCALDAVLNRRDYRLPGHAFQLRLILLALTANDP